MVDIHGDLTDVCLLLHLWIIFLNSRCDWYKISSIDDLFGYSAMLDPTCPETAFQCHNCNNYKEINYNHRHNSATLIYFVTEKRLCEVYDMEVILCCSKGLHLTGCNNHFSYLGEQSNAWR